MVCGNTFKTLSIPNRKSWGARENVHPTLCVMCQVSCVTCHVSPVMCRLSHVKCNFFLYPEKKLDKMVKIVGGWSVINGAYPV